MGLSRYLRLSGRTQDCGQGDATKGWFFQEHPEKEAEPSLCFLPPSTEIWPWVVIQQLHVWGLPSCFCCIFCWKKKKKMVGGVRLMRWVWVISHSNHWHLQWQDVSAYVIVHCSNSLSLKFSACTIFLKIYHRNIKDLMQCFVQPLEFDVNWTSSMLYPGCSL